MNGGIMVIYLVTGATGHLGNTIISSLTGKGMNVRALVLPGEKTEGLLPESTMVYSGDVCDKASLERFFAVPDGEEAIVIHCAGIVSITSAYRQAIYDVNVTGTKNIVDQCIASRVKKLVYISSVHALPELPNGQMIEEIRKFSPDSVMGQYAKTKAEATAYVLAAADKGLDVSVLHPSGIIGPNDYGHGHTTQMIIDYCKGRLTAGVTGGYDFVDVRDVAEGVISCCGSGKPGECYILANRFCTVRELFTILGVKTKKKVRVFLPMGFAKAMAPLAELYYKMRRQTPLFTAYSLATLCGNASFSNEKAKRELKFTRRPLAQTLNDTVDWLKKQKRV
jgi:dihydroflavonol-4-reductase